MQFSLGNHTSIGRVRTANEDAFGNWPTPNGHLFVVCDGMGGHIGGAIASQAAVSAIYQTMASQKFPSGPIALEYCLTEANKKLHNIVTGNPSLHGMGTTAVAVLIQDDAAYYAHIGDSRLYLFRQNALRRLTRDHSFVQSLVDQGHINEEEAEKHPRRNEIYRALGIGETVEPAVAASPLMLQPGDRLLLCTDGLNGMIGDKGISGVMGTRGLTVQQQAEKLVQLADEAGGHDNTTVQIIMMRPSLQPSIGEPVGSAAAMAAAPSITTAPTTTPTAASSKESVPPVTPPPPAAVETDTKPKEHFLQPAEEGKPRKPLLPIIGGVVLFLALLLLLYNVFKSPDTPRLGMEEQPPIDTTTAISGVDTAAPISTADPAPAPNPEVNKPVPATPPPPVASDTGSAPKKETPPKDTARKPATTPTPTTPAPKKDTVRKVAPRPAPVAPPKPVPNGNAEPGARTPKAVMPTEESAP